MVVREEIIQRVQQLPAAMQAEVLQFVENLLKRVERDNGRAEDREWFDLSLQSALRDSEDESAPDYAEADLKERYS